MTVNREGWPPGPWDGEPDDCTWTTDSGLLAHAHRHPRHGTWCGYVAVPKGHPFHRLAADHALAEGMPVHGGVTYAGDVCPACEARGLAFLGKVWWIGFDCGHYTIDVGPGWLAFGEIYRGRGWLGHTEVYPGAVYRTLDYVRIECEKMAAGLACVATMVAEGGQADEKAMADLKRTLKLLDKELKDEGIKK